MANTANYNLPLFEANAAVDMIATYNVAMNNLDNALKQLTDKTAHVFNPQSGDTALTVSELAKVKKDASGIIYFAED